MRSLRLALAGLIFAILSLALGSCTNDDGDLSFDDAAVENADFNYVIPLGAGERIDAGEALDILPARLEAKVGQVIRISNEDDRGHLVGPFFVGAHEELSQRFTSVGELSGTCSVHPSGQFVVAISE